MMRSPRFGSHRLSTLVLGGAIGAASLLHGGDAEAGRVRFSGGAHFSGHVRVRGGGGGGGGHYARSRYWYPRYPRFGGSVWIGGYYYPRPYYYYYPEYVPSYYPPPVYYPVQPQVAPVAVAPEPPPMPTFGIGIFAGGSSVRDEQVSSDLGALARIRFTPGLLIEGEIAKTSFKDDVRVDRRIGGSLIWEIGARHTVAPYLLAGAGVSQADVDGSFTTTQNYGELGVGLRVALSRNLHIAGDIRAGTSRTVDSDQPNNLSVAARSVAPPSSPNDENEDYTRARLAAILSF